MRQRSLLVGLLALGAATLAAAGQNPPTQNPPAQTAAQNPPAGRGGGAAGDPATGQRRGGGGGGRRGVTTVTLSTTAWPDGGQIPAKYSQAGAEVSPPLTWTGLPADGLMSLVLLVHDIDAPAANGTDDLLQWLVWNIPPATTSLREGVGQGPELPDGTRQISVTGPNYRGPAAPATGPVHHYLFELYALDTTLEVMPVGAPPAATRAAVFAAMAGHIRAKGTMVGLYRLGNR